MLRLNLRSKILLMVIPLVVLPLLVLGWYAYTTLLENSRENLFGQMSTMLNQVERSVGSHLSTARANIELFAGSRMIRKYVLTREESVRYTLLQPSLIRLFASYQRAYPSYYELRILLEDGYEDTRSTLEPLPNRTDNEKDFVFFRRLQQTDESVHAMYTYNEDTGDPALYVGKKLLFRDESVDAIRKPPGLRGYLVLTADLEFLEEQLKTQVLGTSGYLFVTDANGVPILWPGRSGDAATKSVPVIPKPVTEQDGSIHRIRLRGEDVYLQKRSIHNNLDLYAALPVQDLRAAGQALGLIVAIITILTVLLVSVLIFVLINWILIHPIRRIGSVANDIGIGRTDVNFTITSNDEIGDLALSLEEMSRNLKQSQEQITFLAYRDPLTGLPNRRMFYEHIQATLSGASRRGQQFALLFLDLDNFKQVNDTLGHQAGDRLLREFARRISQSIRKEDQATCADAPGDKQANDAMARLGGDEFLILLSEIGSPADVADVARRLLDIMSSPFEIGENRFVISSSIGISIYPEDGDDADSMIQHADIAMYHAKVQGRNNYQFYNESMNADAMMRLKLENDLRNAIEQDEFELYYQPKVELPGGRITGVEALIRWNHPEKGVIAPCDFIGIAETTGLILPIGAWVIDEATRQLGEWKRQGIRLSVSINISIVQINQQDLLDIIRRSLEKNGCAAGDIEIELTETCIMNAYEQASALLEQLRNLGVRISMDDFGVGYSSFSYLRNLPIDILKIDQSFINDIATNESDAEIVSAIVAMAHTLNLEVVAEGVETIEQINYLLRQQCDIAQGYLISRPVSAGKFEQFIRTFEQYDFKSIKPSDPKTRNPDADRKITPIGR